MKNENPGKAFEEFIQLLSDRGFVFKDGKQPAFRGRNQKRFIRLHSLGKGYSEEELRAVIAGKSLYQTQGTSTNAPEQRQFHLLIDIQKQERISYLLISHDPEVIRFMADRWYTLDKGALKQV